ncbi:hypothetical protein BGZ63DRAFT_406123 [Mariannaea sp. PMI_226]|nr:hypothetical protein BGZ63DRAFT_406123 [Mariannaea sp. PMI_226]
MLGIFNQIFNSPLPWTTQTTELPTNADSLSSFSGDVAKKLTADMSNLPPGPGVKIFRGLFTVYLESIVELPEFSLDATHTSKDKSRILIVLDNLESLCQWPLNCEQTYERSNVFVLEQYPTLRSLLLPQGSASYAISAFLDARRRRDRAALALWTRLRTSFEDLSAEPDDEDAGPGLSDLKKSVSPNEDYEDNQAFILSLYQVLSEHFKSACPCPSSIILNLRLNWLGKEVINEMDALCFSLYLKDHITAPIEMEAGCRWQDILISIRKTSSVNILEPPKNAEADVIRISEETKTLTIGEPREDDGSSSSSESDEIDEFCELLWAAEESQLKFTYSSRFEYQGPCQSKRPFLRTSPSIPLSRLVGSGKLSDRMKLLLSFLLVRTLWQYYESDWMNDDWGKESVHFMFDIEDGSHKVISIHEPFLQTLFNKSSPDEQAKDSSTKGTNTSHRQRRQKRNSERKTKLRTHPYPKFLALGIMLLEIELDKKLEDFGTLECRDSDTTNVRHTIAGRFLQNQDRWPPKDIWRPVRQAIEICIKPDTEVLGTNERWLRRKYFEEVVRPFQQFVAEAWPDPGQEMIPVRIDNWMLPSSILPASAIHELITDEATDRCVEVAQCQTQLDGVNMTHGDISSRPGIGSTMSSEMSFTADGWFRDLGDLSDVLRITKRRRDQEAAPVKVAILDTGIKESYYQLVKGNIKVYKDFVTKDDSIRQDGTGHGTLCLQLLQKVYEEAEIYVGRVFREGHATNETKLLMIEAIREAITEWKVEVICLPSGFKEECLSLKEVIGDAVHAKTLIFAAASNYGNVEGIYYPARYSRTFQVFCMFSTNADSKPYCNFNPGANAEARYNFAILGEGIRLLSLTEGVIPEPVRGTSFSTIIAAGIAAQIIDFSRHPDVRGKIYDHQSLRKVDGMSAVFARMVSSVDNRYHCLSPWLLLDGKSVITEDKQVIREEIWTKISNALKEVNNIRP